MNYQRIHDAIIARGIARGQAHYLTGKKRDGFEKHHIVPRSLMGGDNKANIVYLTLHEHRLIHHLLAIILDGSMQWAWSHIAVFGFFKGLPIPEITAEVAADKGLTLIYENKPLERKLIGMFNMFTNEAWGDYILASQNVSSLFDAYHKALWEHTDGTPFNFRKWITPKL
ncbi:hypothetical protein GJ904_20000 [Salmonella enterica]|nr:HNH endonuclease [Salmonella enterica subsp. enterica serovar Saintpaul]EEC1303348.1 hypothetical protein [Salmonella enterica]